MVNLKSENTQYTMGNNIRVKKRNGKFEDFDVNKINKVLQWAVEGISDVSFEDVAMNAHFQIFDGMYSVDIHTTLIESAANLITETHPNYQIVAGRLLNYKLRKDVWGGKNAPKLYDLVKSNVDNKIYAPEILDNYTKQEFDKLDEWIKHDRDLLFPYGALKQFKEKYLIQNRSTGQVYETPQFCYMLIAMTLFSTYGDNKMQYVRKAYNTYSKLKNNLPSPIMNGVRSMMKSYASCALFAVDDTLDSIFANVSAIGHGTAKRYGIGVNLGRIRAEGAPIRNGESLHTGIVPFAKVFESTVKSCHQNSIRGGSATANVPWFHHDIMEVLVLKNNAGTDDNRVRKLDYCIGVDKLLFERYLHNKDITLFSYHEVPELWDNFGFDTFQEVYENAEKNPNLKFKKVIPAKDLVELYASERFGTGRIYQLAVDHANSHGSWLGQVDMTNLCVEITQVQTPIKSLYDPDGEIGVCVLAAINLLEIKDDKDDSDLRNTCDIIVRTLDRLIDAQEYFIPAAKNFATKRRSLGIGITNLAAWFAKHKTKYYDKDAPALIADMMEKITYYMFQASVQLAKEFGPCEKFNETKYSKGILPIDTYKRDIDEFVPTELKMDWESLRSDILKFGMRHSTLFANMPCEASSIIQNSTNGVEPPRGFITVKGSKNNYAPCVVPNLAKYRDYYTLAYEMPDNDGLLKVIAAMQKFMDMSTSANTYYNTKMYPDEKVPLVVIIKDLLRAYKYGVKSLYYSNTDDGDDQRVDLDENQEDVYDSNWDHEDDGGCASGACAL